jgi:signal-transduction protein with cAMP-binding, CBS, and nucleotidyltransferase domain
MSEIGLRPRMLVKDAMSSPVFTVDEKLTVDKAAGLMDKHELGCVIVTGKDEKPIGIITEKDLVTRVVAKNILPRKLGAKEVMSTPLMTISSEITLSEAARTMSRLNIRRLGVMYKGNLVGIISSKDILNVTPELIEIISETARIENSSVEETAESAPLAGYCDRCATWSDSLKEVEGEFVCEDCRAESASQ